MSLSCRFTHVEQQLHARVLARLAQLRQAGPPVRTRTPGDGLSTKPHCGLDSPGLENLWGTHTIVTSCFALS